MGLKLNFPPKTCIPNNAKITINKNKSNKSDIIERNELSKEDTKFLNECQYFVTY